MTEKLSALWTSLKLCIKPKPPLHTDEEIDEMEAKGRIW